MTVGFFKGLCDLWGKPRGRWGAYVQVYSPFHMGIPIEAGTYKTAVRAWIVAKLAAVWKDLNLPPEPCPEVGIQYGVKRLDV